MRKVWAVIEREFMERVRTKIFLVGTFLGPVLLAGLMVLPALLSRSSGPVRLVVLDQATEGFGEQIESVLAAARRGADDGEGPFRYQVSRIVAPPGDTIVRDSLIGLVGQRDGDEAKLSGVLVVGDSALESGELVYLGQNVSSLSDMGRLTNVLQPVITTQRLARSGVSPTLVLEATKRVDLKTVKVSRGKVTGESGQGSFFLAYIMAFLLYVVLILYGVQVMNAVVEEKSNRIIEVLVSSLTPFELMLGKVVGVGAVGLVQLAIWSGTAALLAAKRTAISGMLGAAPDAMNFPIPAISADLLLVFLLFFILGFFLYSALYAAVGAMCNTPQEAQQSQIPVTLVIAFALISMFSVLSDPTGTLATVFSLIPLTAPIITPVRYSISPLPLPELALSITSTILGMLAVVWFAGRIFRVGILMYGKKPGMGELFRWIKAS